MKGRMTSRMTICVYGASSDAIREEYKAAGEALGYSMARRGHTMIFGGGASGLMGAAARGIVQGGGRCVGIVPSFFNVDGVLFDKCTELIYTETMRERKRMMEERSDAFVMTPGGIGTFDEFFEIFTLRYLNVHQKPIAIFNPAGCFDGLYAVLEKMADEGFLQREALGMIPMFDEADALLEYLETEYK